MNFISLKINIRFLLEYKTPDIQTINLPLPPLKKIHDI